MTETKADIVARLQKDIYPLQGIKNFPISHHAHSFLGNITQAFPNHQFPLGAVHEFIVDKQEELAATGGFVAGLSSFLFKKSDQIVWISQSRKLFPPAMIQFGIDAKKIIFIELKKPAHLLWTMEEVLKCHAVGAVIGEIPEINLVASRRLQLAVEESGVTAFIFRYQSKNLSGNATVARWKISSLPGALHGEMPGVGFPTWKVELLKIRNGKPGTWQVEWSDNKFKVDTNTELLEIIPQKKTG